jgi:hypothetical protein
MNSGHPTGGVRPMIDREPPNAAETRGASVGTRLGETSGAGLSPRRLACRPGMAHRRLPEAGNWGISASGVRAGAVTHSATGRSTGGGEPGVEGGGRPRRWTTAEYSASIGFRRSKGGLIPPRGWPDIWAMTSRPGYQSPRAPSGSESTRSLTVAFHEPDDPTRGVALGGDGHQRHATAAPPRSR